MPYRIVTINNPIIEVLRESGHDVLSIRDAGLSGISDNTVYDRACKEQLIIITMDKDFTRLLRFPPEKCGAQAGSLTFVKK